MAQRRWQDWLSFFLGAWLFVTPYVVGPSATALLFGALIMLASAWALMRPGTVAAEWANLVIGVCTFVAPFIVTIYATAWIQWMVGAFVVLIAFTDIEIMGGGKITHA